MLINPLVPVSAMVLTMLYQLLQLLLEFGIFFKLSTLSSLSMRTVILASSLNPTVAIMVQSLLSTLSNRTPLLMPERSKAKRSTLWPLALTMAGLILVNHPARIGTFELKLTRYLANQYKDYIDYAANNTYRQLITPAQYSKYLTTYEQKCVPAFAKCPGLTGNDAACGNADDVCNSAIESPLEQTADFDVYDIRASSDDSFPPATYSTYLQSSAVMKAIGAQSTYGECPSGPYNKFISSGDSMFPNQSLVEVRMTN